MKKEIKIVVAGGRDFIDYNLLSKTLDDVIIKLKAKGYEEISICSGKARGADSLGEKYAEANNITVNSMPAQWEKFGKSAGYIRNEEMAKCGKLVIAFWDGYSRGTKHMIDLAHKYKRNILVFRY